MNNDVVRISRRAWTRAKIKKMLKNLRIEPAVRDWIMTFDTRTLREDLLIVTGTKHLPQYDKTIKVYSITSFSVKIFVNLHSNEHI